MTDTPAPTDDPAPFDDEGHAGLPRHLDTSFLIHGDFRRFERAGLKLIAG